MIGLAVMRTVKMAWSVDTAHPSLFCYVDGPAEQEFDYFQFTQTLFVHQQIGITLWIRTFTLFCLHFSAFDSQFYSTPAYRLRHFFPYSSISHASLLRRQSTTIYLHWLVRRYAPMWGWHPIEHCKQVGDLYIANEQRHKYGCHDSGFLKIVFFFPGAISRQTCPLPTKGSDSNGNVIIVKSSWLSANKNNCL